MAEHTIRRAVARMHTNKQARITPSFPHILVAVPIRDVPPTHNLGESYQGSAN